MKKRKLIRVEYIIGYEFGQPIIAVHFVKK